MLISLLPNVTESEDPSDVQISQMVELLGEISEPRYLIFDDVEFLNH